MKGTDITPAQLAAAEQFLKTIGHFTEDIPGDRKVTMEWDKFVRVVAWYGAIRAWSIAHGGAVDLPGEVYIADTSAVIEAAKL